MTNSSITAAGGLLSHDLLQRIAKTDPTLTGLKPVDYELAPDERVRDQTARSWSRLASLWATFRQAEDRHAKTDPTATTLTRQRWLQPLLQELGFGGVLPVSNQTIDDKDYPISHQWGNHVPIHLLGWRIPIDRRTAGIPGAAKTSPHSLVQEFLNRSDQHLWGIVTNGKTLRLLRDNASLTRVAYYEADLQAIFDGNRYSDFVTLWRTCHRSRFDAPTPEQCILEQWNNEATTRGIRALDQLREGVEAAIEQLGQGFLTHRHNRRLQHRIRTGQLPADRYLHQLLRLVYRMLFLLVAESRNLLHPADTPDSARQRYCSYYSMNRLQNLSGQRRRTAHTDLWHSLQVTITALDAESNGLPQLGLPSLGSFLWSPDATPDLDQARIDNRHLLNAVHRLSYVQDTQAKTRRPIDYQNLGTEELGSVYESLLELHAVVNGDARTFKLATAAGSERKTTGSYYTPTSLIDRLLDDALNPILDLAEQASDPERALINLRILDPACGSGHFLINAAHRVAGRLATHRAEGVEPSPTQLRTALRDVIGQCVYGIDINPLAVELCKIALWVEANNEGQPLSYLDHHIVCGNSLLGTTPDLLADGIPQKAFQKLTGDDPKRLAQLRKANLQQRKRRNQQILDLHWTPDADLADLAEDMTVINAAEDTSAREVAAKADLFSELQHSPTYTRAKLAADAWCAAFVTPKTPEHPAITDDTIREITEGHHLPPDTLDHIASLTDEYQFLHPHIAFPDIHQGGGFDAVLGNPPWDKVEFKEQEFFAVTEPTVAKLTGTHRKRAIAALADTNPHLHDQYMAAKRFNEGVRALLTSTGAFPLCGKGKINTYAVFAEMMRSALSPVGRVGMIVPTGIASDYTTKDFFADLIQKRSIASLYDFENRKKLFPIDSRYRFCLLTLAGTDRPADRARFVSFAHGVADIDDPDKQYTLTPSDLVLFNPNTRTMPIFRNRRDAEITTGIYRRTPVLVKEGDPDGNPWDVSFKQGYYNMTTDFSLFRTRRQLEDDGWILEGNHFVQGDDRYLPLYVLAMVHQYDHRWATFEHGKFRLVTEAEKQDPTFVAQPEYWVHVRETDQRIGDDRSYHLSWRDVTNATNERTVIFSPHPRAGAGNPLPQLVAPRRCIRSAVSVAASMNSFACDYASRQKLGGTHLNFFYLKQLPVLRPDQLRPYEPFIEARILELCYTAWDMFDFAAELGWRGPPFRWDTQRRTLIRAEIDALMFRLYGISRPELRYIMDTFLALKKGDRRRWGEYRTKRIVLERYDAMVEADNDGRPYQTVLDPGPAHASVAYDAPSQSRDATSVLVKVPRRSIRAHDSQIR